MTAPEPDVAAIAKGLTKAQRAFVCAGSTRRAKPWRAICRHAKISATTRLGNLGRFFEHESAYPWPWRLNALGLLVRAHLLSERPTDAG